MRIGRWEIIHHKRKTIFDRLIELGNNSSHINEKVNRNIKEIKSIEKTLETITLVLDGLTKKK